MLVAATVVCLAWLGFSSRRSLPLQWLHRGCTDICASERRTWSLGLDGQEQTFQSHCKSMDEAGWIYGILVMGCARDVAIRSPWFPSPLLKTFKVF